MSSKPKFSNKPKPPEPRNHLQFDSWQSTSTGHQRLSVGGSFLGSTSWRDTRSSKLAKQYQNGDCLPGRGSSDSSLVPRAFDGKCGPESPLKTSGNWTMLGAEEAKRNQLGVQDIRSFIGIGKRKAEDGFDMTAEKKIKPTTEKQDQERVSLTTEQKDKSRSSNRVRIENEAEIEPRNKPESNISSLDLTSTSDIFAGITVLISGSTLPQISEYKLKHLLVSNGAKISIHMARKSTTHVVIGRPNTGSAGAGGGLSASKLQQEITRGGWKGLKVVDVDWYVAFSPRAISRKVVGLDSTDPAYRAIESIKSGRRLAESRFPGMHVAAKGQRSVAGMFVVRK